ncbi:hypothetical protein ABN253_02040 [Proteus genomosp. 6]|uniref:RiboL-PSP-HEPN domain-containing protein n=1 Tax=Proteus genomosp. 6 TaxID=1311820 RepID=A0ABV1L5F1_9GAMM
MFLKNFDFIILPIIITITCIISIWIGLFHPLFSLNENQVLYLYSNSSQVLAAIYGLTLTGFIFFRNELIRNETIDNTLSDATDNLKIRYRKKLIFITLLSIITLITSNLVISIENIKHEDTKIFFMNLSQTLFIVSLITISFFIFDILEPKKIEKESLKIQEEFDPDINKSDNGDLSEFLKNFNKIERLLKKNGGNFFPNIKYISNKALSNAIFRKNLINEKLFYNINKLISLRNSIVHGAEPVVSNNIVDLSKNVLEELSSSLEKNQM